MRLLFVFVVAVVVAVTTISSLLNSGRRALSPEELGAQFLSFELASPARPGTDSAGQPVNLVSGQEVEVKAKVEGIRMVIGVVAETEAGEPLATNTAFPDGNGEVRIKLRLPEKGKTYRLHAAGLVSSVLRGGWKGSYFVLDGEAQPAVRDPQGIRVLAE
jgi:hypothetical protein